MAELTIDWTPLIDRMKAEGKLTRNTGTNSIKSVKDGIADMSGALQSISRSLVMQSSFLESAYNINADMYELERERARDAARLARLDGPAEPAAPEPQESGSDTTTDDDSRTDKGKSAGLLSTLFSASTFKKAAIVGIAGPFIYGFLKGSIDSLTGGKFSEFEKIVITKLPDLFESIKTSIALIYNNIKDFLETGDIEDLLKDKEGKPIIDLKKLEKAAYKYAPYAIGYLLGGPLGLIGVAVSDALVNALEDITGINLDDHISPQAQAALISMTGLALGASMTSPIVGGAIRGAFVALFTTPYGLAALAVTAGVVALFALLKNGRKRVENLNAEVQTMLTEHEAAIASGDMELAGQIEQKMMNEIRRTNQLAPQTSEGKEANLQARSSVGSGALQRQLEGGLITSFGDDNDARNARKIALSQYASGILTDITPEQRTQMLKNIAALLPDHMRRDIANFDPNNEISAEIQASNLLSQLGVRNTDGTSIAEDLGGYLNTILSERIAAIGEDDFLANIDIPSTNKIADYLRMVEEGFDPSSANRGSRRKFNQGERAYENYMRDFGDFYNTDGTLKTDIIGALTDELKQLAAERGFLVNNGGNTFVGGSSSNQSSIQYNFSTSGLPAQSLANGAHQ
jgi:hypothetical protein